VKPSNPTNARPSADQLPLFGEARAKRARPRSVATTSPVKADRIMRRREVQHSTGFSRSSLYRLIARKEFPPPIRLSKNAVGWLASEVEAWIVSRVAASRREGAGGNPQA